MRLALSCVLLDDFENDRTDFGAVTQQRKEQPVAVIQLGSVELSVMQVDELLYVRRPEIIALERCDHAAVGSLDPRRIKTGIFKDSHRRRL